MSALFNNRAGFILEVTPYYKTILIIDTMVKYVHFRLLILLGKD